MKQNKRIDKVGNFMFIRQPRCVAVYQKLWLLIEYNFHDYQTGNFSDGVSKLERKTIKTICPNGCWWVAFMIQLFGNFCN
jgi:hypothetical protein